MWREEYGNTQDPVAPRGAMSSVADQITEDVMQLLYAAGQEVADIRDAHPDDVHAPLAAQRVHEAIAALREIAGLLSSPLPDPFGMMPGPRANPFGAAAPARLQSVLPDGDRKTDVYPEAHPDCGAAA